ncbi:MAG: thermonuclease family protein [Candidatus Omnitrophota bacterium]|jgi:micrococcal nuclease
MNKAGWVFCAILVLVIFAVCGGCRTEQARYNYNHILVRKVVDGDTLVLASGERVRLIGIDTPEMHVSDKLYRQAQQSKTDIQTIMSLGNQAYKFTRDLVEGKRVRLEFDVERFDKYGRWLAYVYLQDGTFVNAKIIQEGYASLLTIPPNVKYAALFRELYKQARENERGLWKEQ